MHEIRMVEGFPDADLPAIQPVSQMVDSVVLRKDVLNYVGHPSVTTRLREVSKQR